MLSSIWGINCLRTSRYAIRIFLKFGKCLDLLYNIEESPVVDPIYKYANLVERCKGNVQTDYNLSNNLVLYNVV